jgi:biopolymer transport protein TolR
MQTSTRSRAEINVTPLIDVLLVLLIIFMVILPQHAAGIHAQTPEPATKSPAAGQVQIVVSVAEDRTLKINTKSITWDDLDAALRRIFEPHGARVLFVAGAPKAEFEDVARVLDTARGVGIDHVALMPRQR